MDMIEVTLRLDRPVAERLRDPAERARYEAFLGLVAQAAVEADIAEAIALLKASPRWRQQQLKAALAETRRAAAAAALTDADVDAELAAWKRERSVRE